jgi:dihydroxy-acid dehydratase
MHGEKHPASRSDDQGVVRERSGDDNGFWVSIPTFTGFSANLNRGSTNSVLHFLAMAGTAEVPLSLDDFQRVSDKIPFLADLAPSGKYFMEDLYNIGGTPSVLKLLVAAGLMNGNIPTVTGKTLAENIAPFPSLPQDQVIIRPISNPIKATGHLQILRGNLAPGGAVAKITGKEGLVFKGKARVFNKEHELDTALNKGQIPHGEKLVLIVRYEGPKGGPGMPEQLKSSAAIMGAGLKNVALVTDGRYSGASHGFIVGHVVPEAAGKFLFFNFLPLKNPRLTSASGRTHSSRSRRRCRHNIYRDEYH